MHFPLFVSYILCNSISVLQPFLKSEFFHIKSNVLRTEALIFTKKYRTYQQYMICFYFIQDFLQKSIFG
ncbi:hypothetical protein CW304_15225 [Bacillus sp. UFRGS-B20]|nr:hypothetical protein CW304_15225 [Bacillus sp. UFRGS-B20]